MKIKTIRETNRFYLDGSDEYDCESEEIEIEVDDKEIRHLIATWIAEEYFNDNKDLIEKIENFIDDLDLLDGLAEQYKEALEQIY